MEEFLIITLELQLILVDVYLRKVMFWFL